jgi:threonylcarbamoyladenosine tRNA methylthiotransferase MtaB
VQTGCNHHCSYCLTRIARGKSQSRTLPEIQADIESAIAGGAKEIVLTGVQLGSWGQDFLKRKKLANLLKHVLEIEGLQRIRLSSIEPWDIEPALLDFWQDSRLCHHLHIPLQSGDDEILRAMRRPSTTQSYRNLVKGIRKHVPGMAITTDVIVGFPGETESAFTNTLAFIREIAFAGGHVFTFSPRPGTEAYTFEERLAGQVAKLRNAQLRESFNVLGHQYRQKKIGTRRMVLWESSQAGEDGTWMLNGLTDNYIRVIAQTNADIWNKISLVQLKAHYPGSIALEGEIIETIHQ